MKKRAAKSTKVATPQLEPQVLELVHGGGGGTDGTGKVAQRNVPWTI